MAYINDTLQELPNRAIRIFNDVGVHHWHCVEKFIDSDDHIKGIGKKTIEQCKNILADIRR